MDYHAHNAETNYYEMTETLVALYGEKKGKKNSYDQTDTMKNG